MVVVCRCSDVSARLTTHCRCVQSTHYYYLFNDTVDEYDPSVARGAAHKPVRVVRAIKRA